MQRDIDKANPTQQFAQALFAVKALGIELVGNHPFGDMGDHLARDQTLLILGERPFAADKVLFVDPLPTARLKVLADIVAVGNINQQPTIRLENAAHLLQNLVIILGRFKVAKAVAGNHHIVKTIGGKG